jgi:hypothetical protein
LACKRVEDGQVERKRLAAGRSGGDDEMLAALSCVPGAGLVNEELLDAAGGESSGDLRMEAFGDLREARRASRLLADIGDLFALEQVAPGTR